MADVLASVDALAQRQYARGEVADSTTMAVPDMADEMHIVLDRRGLPDDPERAVSLTADVLVAGFWSSDAKARERISFAAFPVTVRATGKLLFDDAGKPTDHFCQSRMALPRGRDRQVRVTLQAMKAADVQVAVRFVRRGKA